MNIRLISVLSSIIIAAYILIVVIPSSNVNNNSMSNVILLRGGGRKIPKNFDRNFHRIMQQSFPDVPARVDYENTQRKLYNSAIRKLRMASSWDLNPDPKKILSEAEQNAMDYFYGTGFYKEQQSLRTPPNKFDTENH